MSSEPIEALEAEVLIVGGGPVGLSAAFELGRRGVECLVVEPRREVSWNRPRAKTTSARTMEHLRRWGIADKLRARALLPVSYSDTVVFCTSLLGLEITRFTDCFALRTERVDAIAESGQQIPQPMFEMTLRDELAGVASVRLLTGWQVEAIDQDEARVHARLAADDGRTASAEASYAIGCDGGRSVVRDSIGVHYLGTTDLRPNLNLVFRASGLHDRHRHPRAIHYWVLSPRVAGVLGPMDETEVWWVIATANDRLAETPEQIIGELVGGPVDAEVLATDPWNARMAIASSYRRDRIFLAGDAAHLNPPWGGHGFNTGVGDAVNLGWKLAAVTRGWGGKELLDSYEAERRPIAEQTVALATKNMAVLAVDLADPALAADGAAGDAARTEAAANIQATKSVEFHSLGLVLGYRYEHSPIVAGEPGEWAALDPSVYIVSARPGCRLPHRWLADGASLYDELGADFTLVVLRPGADASRWSAAAAGRSLPLRVLDASAWGLEGFEAAAVLVRPDQHVAWRGDVTGLDEGAVLDLVRGAPSEF